VSARTLLRWDLDKTYLDTDFESFAALLRVPFERGRHKVAIPGVVTLISELHRVADARRDPLGLYFLSASPVQIGRAIRDKLELDGVRYEGIVFKDQMRHLVRAEFGSLREQVGYKLAELLQSALTVAPGSRELLFGDDWESDPFIYSLYADIVAGRVARPRVMDLLDRIGVDDFYVQRIEGLLAQPLPEFTVESIYILRQRKRAGTELAAFGPRMAWFDDYLEGALVLYADGFLDAESVVSVARSGGFDVARALAAAAARARGPGLGALSGARRALTAAGLLDGFPRGRWYSRARAWLRVRAGLPPASRGRLAERFVAAYEPLVPAWTKGVARDGDEA
jgi:hypothetical protein